MPRPAHSQSHAGGRRRRLRRLLAAVTVVAVAATAIGGWLLNRGDDDEPLRVRSFVTEPGLHPPEVQVDRDAPGASPGYVFVGPKVGQQQAGPMILDRHGKLVWFRDLPGRTLAYDVRPQRYRGRTVLTWWQGNVEHGHGKGIGVIANRSYRVIALVRGGHGLTSDLHEFQLTPQGTALITIYRPVHRDLSALGGEADGRAFDSVVQEVDVRTGKVLFEWHSIRHVGLGESYAKVEDAEKENEPYDYFHVNSIQKQPNGDLLLSARNTDTLYLIDRRTGRVRWRLGGKRSDFQMEPGTRFLGQHDARMLPGDRVAIFDNGFPPMPDRESRVIVLKLDEKRRRATLARTYMHPSDPRSHSQGSEQLLPNGNVFAGWGGDSPYFSEFSASGELLFDARFGPDTTASYRAYRLPWKGRPTTAPKVAARPAGGGRTTVYASWNGATQVSAWQVLGGSTPASLQPVARGDRTGFETAIPVEGSPAYVAVRALDRSGRTLGRSAAVKGAGG